MSASPEPDLGTDDRRAFVTAIEKQHGRRLRRFLAVRLRNAAADLPDLVQEVFLRLLRVQRHEIIRSPEAYLFTVASHVLHQHMLRQSAIPQGIELDEVLVESEAPESDPAAQADAQQRVEQLNRALDQLSPKAHAALILHRRDGFSIEEIGAQLGISRNVAKKYLAKALAHCRDRLREHE
jgi:RNA polymerase sigma-70 factor (ECF subfamily)